MHINKYEMHAKTPNTLGEITQNMVQMGYKVETELPEDEKGVILHIIGPNNQMVKCRIWMYDKEKDLYEYEMAVPDINQMTMLKNMIEKM